jgi:glycosyltransferase involved in cell wall biosynthesis
MNLLFLSETFYPHGGGAELATYLYARLLSEAGHDVIVLTNRFVGETDISKNGKLVTYRLPLFKQNIHGKYSILMRLDVLLSGFLKKMLRWADVVYIPRFWYSAIPLAKGYGKPVIVHLHDYIPVCPLTHLYDYHKAAVCKGSHMICPVDCIYAYEKVEGKPRVKVLASVFLNSIFGRQLNRLITLSDAVICVSHAQEHAILERSSALLSKMHVVYNPVPALPYSRIEGSDFAYFGGPSLAKGFGILYQALALIGGSKQIQVHITGFSDQTREQSKIPNLPSVIPHKWLEPGLYEELFGKIGTVVVPSIWPEPLPYVVTEALLRGRVLIASNIGGIPEQTEGCEGVFHVAAGDSVELAEKMEYVNGLSREVIEDLGASNRNLVTKKFSNEKAVSDFVKICDRALQHLA